MLVSFSFFLIGYNTAMTSDRHRCDKTEHNFVADAFNWEQRVKSELNISRAWSKNWGEVFAPDSPKTNAEKITKLKEMIDKLPVQAMISNTQLSFAPVVPYKEDGKDYKRKSSTFFDE